MSIMSTEAAIRAAIFHRDRAGSDTLRAHWQSVVDYLQSKRR